MDAPRYDLSEAEVDAGSRTLLESFDAAAASGHRFVTVEIDGSDPDADIARSVERIVFEPTFGNDSAEMALEYGPYERSSVFFLILDREGRRAAGVMRIIRSSDAGLKTLNDLEGAPFHSSARHVIDAHRLGDLSTTWELGTVAVLPRYRSGAGAASIQLYRAVYLAALRDGIHHFVSIIDWAPLQKIVDYVGLPFVPLAGIAPAPYLGSERSQPIHGYVPDFYRRMNRKRFTIRGVLARKALGRLVRGVDDPAIWIAGTPRSTERP